MLNIAQVGEKEQIGPQRVVIGEQSQALGAAREHASGDPAAAQRAVCDFSDRNRVVLRRADLRHTRTSRTARAT